MPPYPQHPHATPDTPTEFAEVPESPAPPDIEAPAEKLRGEIYASDLDPAHKGALVQVLEAAAMNSADGRIAADVLSAVRSARRRLMPPAFTIRDQGWSGLSIISSDAARVEVFRVLPQYVGSDRAEVLTRGLCDDLNREASERRK